MSLEHGAYSEIDGAYFIQNEDIDLGMNVWTPINFKGHFDGNGYQISGFYLNDDAYEGAGLFGKVYGNSTIENINLSGNMEVNHEYFMLEDDSIGGVAGLIGTIYLDGSGDVLISNCAVDVEIYGNNSPFVAGVVGMINAEESTDTSFTVEISGCRNYGYINIQGYANAIYGGNDWDIINGAQFTSGASGILGIIKSSATINIYKCGNFGDITVDSVGKGSTAGGIISTTNLRESSNYVGKIYNPHIDIWSCYNYGNITADFAGGIAGIYEFDSNVIEASSYITASYNVGNIYGNVAGGIAATCGTWDFWGGPYISGINTIVRECYNVGSINADSNMTTSLTGGICGMFFGDTLSNCYNIGLIGWNSGSIDYLGGIVGAFAGINMHTSYNASDLSACSPNQSAGGLIGCTVDNSYSQGQIDYCFNLGYVDGDQLIGKENVVYDYGYVIYNDYFGDSSYGSAELSGMHGEELIDYINNYLADGDPSNYVGFDDCYYYGDDSAKWVYLNYYSEIVQEYMNNGYNFTYVLPQSYSEYGADESFFFDYVSSLPYLKNTCYKYKDAKDYVGIDYDLYLNNYIAVEDINREYEPNGYLPRIETNGDFRVARYANYLDQYYDSYYSFEDMSYFEDGDYIVFLNLTGEPGKDITVSIENDNSTLMTYKLQYTNASNAATSFTLNTTITLPTPTGKPTGYDQFLYWEVDTPIKGNWVQGTHYSVGQQIKGMYGDVWIKAVYTTIQYTITYNPNGGSVDSTTLSYNRDDTTSLATPMRDGYTFNGWKPSSSVGSWNLSSTYKGSVYGKYGNVTLVAQWTPITYYVAFKINTTNSGASGTMTNQTFTYGTAQALKTNTFKNPGYVFYGWATSEDSGAIYADGEVVSNLTTTSRATVNLYAVWGGSYYAHYDSTGKYWYIEIGSMPQTKVTDSAIINELNNDDVTDDLDGVVTSSNLYYFAGSMYGAKSFQGIDYCNFMGNWYKVEPIRWRLKADSNFTDGYVNISSKLLLMDKIVTVGQYSINNMSETDGYISVNETFSYSNYFFNNFNKNDRIGLVNYLGTTDKFSSGGTVTESLTNNIFLSSQEEIAEIMGGEDYSAEFSDLVKDYLSLMKSANMYYVRDLGTTYNNAVCYTESGGINQRYATTFLGMRYTLKINGFICEN